jgi:undecaprenyl-diphosphatase
VPDWLIVALLGIVEGITEFLPVSSTAHLLACETFIPGAAAFRNDLFNVVIQCGAVLAVIPLFRARIAQLSRWKEPRSRELLAKISCAFLITAVGGLMLEKSGFKLSEKSLTIVAAVIFAGGVLFIVVEGWMKGTVWTDEITWTIAVTVGAAQLLAIVFPGASRSGTSILLSLLLGLSRPAATEFSFLVGIPTMLAAGAFKILKEIHHPAGEANWPMILLASIIAALVSFIAVKWLLRFVQTHTFSGFGWYRIFAGGALLFFALRNS